jgi:hypothetical protein
VNDAHGTFVALREAMFARTHLPFPLPLQALAASCALVLLPTAPAQARDGMAKTVIALDVDYAAPVSESETDGGGGGALRVGEKLDLVLVSLTPEIGGSYHGFGGDRSPQVYRGFIGGRVGIGKVIEPSIFAHVGAGKIDGAADYVAPTVDVGAALDLTLLPIVNLGVHASYDTLLAQDDHSAFDWYILGIHAALEF